MSDRVITAEAIISGKDLTGDMFAQIARKANGVGKNISSISPTVEGMAKSIQKANEQLKALDRMASSQKGLADARQRFNAAKDSVVAASRAMQAAEGSTKKLAADYASAQRAVSQASAAFDKQKTAAIAAKRALEGFGAPVSKIASEQSRLKSVIDSTTRSIERQIAVDHRAAQAAKAVSHAAPAIGHGRGFGGGFTGRLSHATGFAGLVGGYGIVNAAERTLETYRHFDSERRYGQAVMGITDEQQAPLIKQAIHGGATSKYNDIQWLEAQRTLAARGLKLNQVMAITQAASTLGQATDKSLPEAAKVLEGGLFGFGKDTSTYDKALANAKRTADLQVKATKAFGMEPEDLIGLYKLSAAPFRMAGLSEEQMLTFGGMGKKSNMGGDEMGTASRALVANLLKPTAGARTAMLANGIDYSKYQKQGGRPMDVEAFSTSIAGSYGVTLKKGAKDALQAVFNDKAVVGDAAKFMPRVMSVLSESLGGKDAKSKKSIAGEARRFRDASMSGVDAQALFNDLMPVMARNPAFANAFMGSKQGARMMAALGNPEEFLHKYDELKNHSTGFAKSVSDARMAGFDGAVSRFQNSIKNLETAIGRSVDNDGKGGALTWLTNKAGGFVQGAAEMKSHEIGAVLGTGAAGGALAGGLALRGMWRSMSGGFGLTGSATALTGSAEALTAAAGRLGVAGGLPGKAGAIASKMPLLAAPVGLGAGAAAAAGLGIGGLGLIAGGVGAFGVGGITYGLAKAGAIDPTKPDAQAGAIRARQADMDKVAEAQARIQGAGKWKRGGRFSTMPLGVAEQYGPPMPPEAYGPAMPPPSFSNVPLPPGRPRGMGNIPGPIDVTGKVQADVKSDVHVDTSISTTFKLEVPPGFGATQTNVTTVSRPSVGKSMPGASRPGYDSVI